MSSPEAAFDSTRTATPDDAGNDITVVEEQSVSQSDDQTSQWRVGDLILGTYQVKRIHDGGGMGRVYRVYHRDWNRHLAVKCPRLLYFRSETHKQNFVRECLAWIGLGVHPNIITCHYVRTLGGIPRVFAEYAEGGSLRDRIRSRELYRGTQRESLTHILDLCIQFAWGLEFSHSKGLIHQDVKPANVLLTSEGLVKVSDFGLSNARIAAGETSLDTSALAADTSYAGMTPAYCSPEQAQKKSLTRQTDIWSWATSFLELLVGSIQWKVGCEADTALERYLSNSYANAIIANIPDTLSSVLRSCLRRDPRHRPDSFGDVILELKDIYRATSGREYGRSDPRAAEGLADVLNNQALSLADLGLHDEARRRFDATLEADPHHPEGTYNRGLHLWRAGALTDADVIERLKETRKVHEGEWRVAYLLGMVHLERLDLQSALSCFVEAQNQGCGVMADTAVARVHELRAHTCQTTAIQAEGKSISHVCTNGDGRFALTAYEDKTVGLWDTHLKRCLHVLKGHDELARSVDHRYLSVSVALNADGRFALTTCAKTIRLWDTATGTCKWEYEDSEDVSSPCLSADGLLALWEGQSKVTSQTKPGAAFRLFCLFDIQRQKPLLRKQRGQMDLGAALSPDGRRLLSGFSEVDDANKRTEGLILWDVETGKEITRFCGHTSWVRSVAFSSDGTLALSASQDDTVRVWEIQTGKVLHIFTGNHPQVLPGSYGRDGQILLFGDHIQRWDNDTGKCLRTFDSFVWNKSSDARALSADGRVVILGQENGTIVMSDAGKPAWPQVAADPVFARNMNTEEALGSEAAFENCLTSARVLANEEDKDVANALVMVRHARALPGRVKDRRALELWATLGLKCVKRSLSDAWQLRTLQGHTGNVSSVCFTQDSKFLLSAGDSRIRVWDTATGECVRVLEGHDSPVNSIMVSDDGLCALSASGFSSNNGKDNSLRLWDLRSGECVRVIDAGPLAVEAAVLGVNSGLIVSGNGSLLDELTKGLLFETRSDGELIHSQSSRDKDVSLRFWDAKSGNCLRVLTDHRLAVTALAMSADSQLVVSGSLDCTVRLWNVSSGQCLHKIDVKGWVDCVALDINTRSAFFQNTESAVARWDLDEHRVVRTFDGHGNGPKAIALSQCGKFMLTGAADKKLRLWEVNTGRELIALEGHTESVDSVAWSSDACLAASGGGDGTVRLWRLDWECDFPGWSDWDEGARPFLQTFLRQRACRVSGPLRRLFRGITFEVNRRLSDPDFEKLLMLLSFAGYGWLRPEGVRRELERMGL